MIDLPPPPPRRIIGKIGSGLEIQAVVGYDYSDLREYGEACACAALEAQGKLWELMSDVQVVSNAPSLLPGVLLDGWERTVLREGDCVIALRRVHK